MCSTHQKKWFSTILGNFLENWIFDSNMIGAGGPYKNSENFVLSKIVLRKYCWVDYFFQSSKEVFLYNFRQFLENWIFDGNSTGGDLTKLVKILYCLKLC